MKRTNYQKGDKPSFRRILNGVASQNARLLMHRARVANKLAKSLSGHRRASAYFLKTQALLELATRFPERVRIINDPFTPRFVLVKVPRARFGLHVPAKLFRRKLVVRREWILFELASRRLVTLSK